MRQVILLVSLALVVLGLAACGATSTQTFKATLNGQSERPNPVTTVATGSVNLELKDKVMTLTGNFTSLSGAATAAHIHGPADESNAAPPVPGITLTVTAAAAGDLSASKTLTDAEIADLKAGKWYVNVHTGNNPGGEIRGQLK